MRNRSDEPRTEVKRRARRRMRRLARAVAALVVVGAAGPVLGQSSASGPPFQVNTDTTDDQVFPAVAADGQGRFVVVWESDRSGGAGSPSWSVQARRYQATGIPVGDEFQVSADTTAYPLAPAVAADGQGRFVVAWTFYTGGSGYRVRARRYDASGIPSGSEFPVATDTTFDQVEPAVAADGQGNFVVIWSGYGSTGTDTSGFSIHARLFDGSGAPLGPRFQVNSYTTNHQVHPAVARDGSGNFVVVWTSVGSSGTDTSGGSVQARRFEADGTPLGAEVQVNLFTTGHQWFPSVAADGQGRFVVAWASNGSSGSDTSLYSVQARRYDADGNPLGDEFQVNTYTSDNQWFPAVAADSQGNFLVSWESLGGVDADGWSVQARRYHADGTPRSAQFQVNTYTTADQRFPAVAADGSGNFVVAFSSLGSNGSDTDGSSIFARRFDALFRDGFESSGTARWSATSP